MHKGEQAEWQGENLPRGIQKGDILSLQLPSLGLMAQYEVVKVIDERHATVVCLGIKAKDDTGL